MSIRNPLLQCWHCILNRKEEVRESSEKSLFFTVLMPLLIFVIVFEVILILERTPRTLYRGELLTCRMEVKAAQAAALQRLVGPKISLLARAATMSR